MPIRTLPFGNVHHVNCTFQQPCMPHIKKTQVPEGSSRFALLPSIYLGLGIGGDAGMKNTGVTRPLSAFLHIDSHKGLAGDW